eukprot:c14174_g1_i2.p1 GENE.c14174_g1_i2~~c14174_g1_i2.p1  ORF type:complete len:313 (+),score=56.03 c14174_g1_i2:102-941(+)
MVESEAQLRGEVGTAQHEGEDNGPEKVAKQSNVKLQGEAAAEEGEGVFVTEGVGVNSQGDMEGDFGRVRCKCLVQLSLVPCVADVVSKFYSALPQACSLSLLQILQNSFLYAHSFNKDIAFRIALTRAGALKHLPNELPSLLKLEVSALLACLRVGYLVGLSPNDAQQHAWSMFVDVSKLVLMEYAAKDEHVSSIPVGDRDLVCTEQSRELAQWTKAVIYVLESFGNLPTAQLIAHLPDLLPHLITLITCSDISLRVSLRSFLTKHRSHLLAQSASEHK